MKRSTELLPRDFPAIGLRDEYPAGFVDPMHSHDHDQILYGSAGVMLVRTPETSFLIPPQRALWLPAGIPHEVICRSRVSLRTVYLPQSASDPDRRCRAFEVSALLRDLILKAVAFSPASAAEDRQGRVIALMREEIDRMSDAACAIAMPSDPRLTGVCEAILRNPCDRRGIDDWAALAAMGRRTLTRRFRQEMGISLAAWQRQVRLVEALAMLATGSSITQASLEVGYQSPAAFTAMFTRTLGEPPRRYLEFF